jgi:restriction system protein
MARQNESILDVLIKLPWWVSVVCSVAAFVFLRYIVPLFVPAGPATSSNYALKGLLSAAVVMAPLVAFVLFIPAPIAAFRQWRERRLLDSQEGLETIRTLSWARFETLMTGAYRRQGYSVARPGGDGGPDGGVDLVLRKDGDIILVQCKQWKAWKVGVRVARELFGVMTARKAHGGIIVTSGLFTQEARRFAAGKPIDLVDGPQLAALIRTVQTAPATAPAIPTRPRSTPTQGPAAPAQRGRVVQTGPPQPAPKKICPRCGADMVLRTAKRGAHSGQQFWGCADFPTCRATLPAED